MNILESSGSIRTFYRRHGRMHRRHHDALERLYPVWGVDRDRLPPFRELFGRDAPVVLEIGSGMGESSIEIAAADPDRDYLACEVHQPGIANLLDYIAERGITNLRVFDGDALALAKVALPPESLDAVIALFPDPWPKARHHKRRLIRGDNVALLRTALRPGGTIHCATDWAQYADDMLQVLSSDPELVNRHAGFAPRPHWRPYTKFEQRGMAAGREIFDVEFAKRG